MTWAVVQVPDAELRADPVSPGMAIRPLIGADTGSVHLSVDEVELAAGVGVAAHTHPFEESFYVLDGRGVVTIGATSYRVRSGDFGLVPVGVPHAWHNGGEPTRVLRVRAPQPRSMRDRAPSFPAEDLTTSDPIDPPREVASPWHPVGRFDDHQLPAPGPLAMKGYRGPRIRGISLWMLIDELVGATHHTMFVVEFAPGAARQSAGDHYHPFEEVYYFVAGSAIAHLDGEDVPVSAGDVVFCGVNALHGYTVTSDVPVRWIEVQAPAPPPHGATFFPDDWVSG